MRTWADIARVHLADGMLPFETKLLIGSVSARMDNYEWFLRESERRAERRPIQESKDTRVKFSDQVTQKILSLAQDISLHSNQITQARIDELRDCGMKDPEILEAICVAGFFNGESRLYKCLA
jgi:alkylhydroperoxidase family enzyme